MTTNGFTIYRAEDAGCPDVHEADKWYFEPTDWQGGDVYSPAYDSREEAEAAAEESRSKDAEIKGDTEMTTDAQTIWLYNENCVCAGEVCQEEREIEEESGDIHKVEGTEEELIELARTMVAESGAYRRKCGRSILRWFRAEEKVIRFHVTFADDRGGSNSAALATGVGKVVSTVARYDGEHDLALIDVPEDDADYMRELLADDDAVRACCVLKYTEERR